jgi:hypothetical protein
MKSHLKETWIKILKLFYRPKQIFTGVKTAIPEKFIKIYIVDFLKMAAVTKNIYSIIVYPIE